MATQVQLRRGTAAENNAFTGALGEVTVDTTNNTLRVHDGVTQGGNEIVSMNKFYSYASNCIIEIPQDITLALNNGIYVKSGSKIYYPDGTSKTLTSDTSVASGGWGSQNEPQFVFCKPDRSLWGAFPVQYCQSGSTLDTTKLRGNTTGFWYDTTNENIKFTNDGGSTFTSGFSFPLGIVTEATSGNIIDRIDQVFNGFGYIGSTIFVLPGVKGLRPNSRNTDGTLKTKIVTSAKVLTYTTTSSLGTTFGIIDGGQYLSTFAGREYDQEEYPGNNYKCWYKPSENKLYNTMTGEGSKVESNSVIIGYFNSTTGDFAPKYAFKALDYNDSDFIANCAMPSSRYIDLTLPATGGTVTAPADGYFYIYKTSGANNEFVTMTNSTTGFGIDEFVPNGMNARLFLPASKGDVITFAYTLSGVTNMFRFIYANGAK